MLSSPRTTAGAEPSPSPDGAQPHSLAGDPHPVRHGVMAAIGAMFFGVPIAGRARPEKRTFAPARAPQPGLSPGRDT